MFGIGGAYRMYRGASMLSKLPMMIAGLAVIASVGLIILNKAESYGVARANAVVDQSIIEHQTQEGRRQRAEYERLLQRQAEAERADRDRQETLREDVAAIDAIPQQEAVACTADSLLPVELR